VDVFQGPVDTMTPGQPAKVGSPGFHFCPGNQQQQRIAGVSMAHLAEIASPAGGQKDDGGPQGPPAIQGQRLWSNAHGTKQVGEWDIRQSAPDFPGVELDQPTIEGLATVANGEPQPRYRRSHNRLGCELG
jgi:hypothetical protein